MDNLSDYIENNKEDNQQLLPEGQASHSKRRNRNSEQRHGSGRNNSELSFNTQTLPPGLSTSQDQCTSNITQMASIAEPFYNNSSSDYHPSRLDMNPQQQMQQQEVQQQYSSQQSEYYQYSTTSRRNHLGTNHHANIQQSQLQQIPSNHFAAGGESTTTTLPVPHQQRQFLNHGFPGHQVQLQTPQEQSIYTMQDQTTRLQSAHHITMRTPYIQPIHARNPMERPSVRLSVNLIDTYKRINENYYKNKRRRENAEAAADATAVAATKADKSQERKNQGVHNHGWDDENYDYILRRGEILNERYKVEERIGKGSFGQVVRAFDMVSNTDVAIKIIKSKRPFLLQARTEIELLTHLKHRDSEDQYNIGKLDKIQMLLHSCCCIIPINPFPFQCVFSPISCTRIINVLYLRCYH
jgi:Serine/threonine protein kinase